MPYHCSYCLSTTYSTVHFSGDACPYCGATLGKPESMFQPAPLAALGSRTNRLRGAALIAAAASAPTTNRDTRPVAH
jgi:hypothetical protein